MLLMAAYISVYLLAVVKTSNEGKLNSLNISDYFKLPEITLILH